MATSSVVQDMSSFSTDAKFRAWGAACNAALTASGLTQTADTGQINWTTVARPTVANTKQGYEIWRFNDTLQSTRPIFLRFDYGSSGNSSGTNPGTWLTVGTATDGAGNISGVGMPVTQGSSETNFSFNTVAQIQASYSASAGALFTNFGQRAGTGNYGLWVVARTCDSSTGVTTGDGVVVYNHGVVTAPKIACASYSPAQNYASRNPGSGSLSPAASVTGGTAVQLYKNYALIPTPYGTNGAVSYYTSDITANAVFSASPFGATHSYQALGVTYAPGHDSSNSASMVGAYIWE